MKKDVKEPKGRFEPADGIDDKNEVKKEERGYVWCEMTRLNQEGALSHFVMTTAHPNQKKSRAQSQHCLLSVH